MSGRGGVVTALLLGTGCAAPGAVMDRGDVMRQILPSTVQLRAERDGGGRRAGSGVVIAADPAGERSWVVTTRHFLDPPLAQEVYVTALGRKGRVRARVGAVSPDQDLAIVEVPGLVLPPVRLREAVSLGHEVWVVAYPWGRRQTVVSGVVSQLASDEGEVSLEGPPRMVDASVSYGSSGGGVFEATSGALVGIVESYRTARVAVPEAGGRALDLPVPGETTVIPSRAILRFLATTGLEVVVVK